MKSVSLVVVVMLMLSMSVAWAGSPADVDLFFRLPKAACVKVGDDVTAQWVYLAAPVTKDKNVSVMLYDWNATNGKKLNECGLTVRTSKATQVGIIMDDWNKGEDKVNILLDTTQKSTSMVALVPIDDTRQTTLGVRQKITNDVTAYGKFCNGSKPLLGVSYSSRKITVDVAYGSNTAYLRVSKSFGQFTPEARLRFTPNENYYGWAIAKKF